MNWLFGLLTNVLNSFSFLLTFAMWLKNYLANHITITIAMSLQTSKLDFLEGKNVFIFDTETTGLPERVPGAKWGTASEYWPYNMSSKYTNARLVSIAWVYIMGFTKLDIDLEKLVIPHYIRKPEGFTEIPTTHIHGISYSMAVSQGLPLLDIFLQKGLKDILDKVDYIIAHNVMFDIHILQSELYKLQTEDAMKAVWKIENMKKHNQCICSAELGRDLCKLDYKRKTAGISSSASVTSKKPKTYKIPKLVELYKHFYGEEFENQHDASGDVLALVKCLIRM